MAKKQINYSTPEEQLKKLKSQNLIISNDEHAKSYLQLYGYSNLIKSYRDPYVISKSFGTYPNNYLNFRNYLDRKKAKSQFRLSSILNTMNSTLHTTKDPIHHYLSCYGIVPPRILFKSLYFTTVINYIALFKPKQHEEMALQIYDIEKIDISLESSRKLMMDTFYMCSDYRNIAAHGGRIYNYSTHCILRTHEIFGYDNSNIFGFGQLLLLLSLLNYKSPYERLKSALNNEVNRHCNCFPQDSTYLGQILNINTISKDIVYITHSSNKYHSNPHCSGIKHEKEILYKDAINNNYIACKRCFDK